MVRAMRSPRSSPRPADPMSAGGWFGRRGRARAMDSVPDGLALKCEACDEIIFAKALERTLQVCPKCGYHRRLGAQDRLEATVDEDSFVEMDRELQPSDPLLFPDYADKIRLAREKTGLDEALVTGRASIEGMQVLIAVSDFGFMGGSMGSVYGEKITRTFERAADERLPAVVFSASGGARMQEGLIALMQMAKTSAAVQRLARARVPYISVLTNPTTGGVFASYASLADVTLAEPGAVVGFAGRRVGRQDLGGHLPANFQTSEFQLEHGMVDRIVPRRDMRGALAYLLRFFSDKTDDGS